MTSTLPVPSQHHVRRVRALLAEHQGHARRALIDCKPAAYRDAMAEVQVCQSWLDTYVDRRAS